jgi:hypothetical protein
MFFSFPSLRLDLATLYIKAWDSQNQTSYKVERWQSPIIRMYPKDCHTPISLQQLSIGCEQKNYTFGPYQNDVQIIQNLSGKKDCFEKCIENSCNAYSWDSSNRDCTISTSSDIKSIYLCGNEHSFVKRVSILCKNATQISKEEEDWAVKNLTWIRSPKISEQVTDLGQCYSNCKNCTTLSWNPKSRLCQIAFKEEIEICQFQTATILNKCVDPPPQG